MASIFAVGKTSPSFLWRQMIIIQSNVMEEKMKNIITNAKNYIAGFIFFTAFLFINTTFIFSQNDQSVYITDNENITITTMDPDPMISDPINEKAMAAYIRGSQFMHQNRLNEAERFLKEAIELYPDFVDALDHLGIVYRRMSRFEEAEQMYLRSIAINNTNRVPYLNLAIVYRIMNRANEAFALYNRVIEINPNDPEGYYGTGELHFGLKNYELSLQFFNKAIELYTAIDSPYVYHAFYYKGMTLYYLKNYEEALKYLEDVQKANINIEGLTRTINEIRKLLSNNLREMRLSVL